MNKMMIAGAGLLATALMGAPIAAWSAAGDPAAAPDRPRGGPPGDHGWMRPGPGMGMGPGMMPGMPGQEAMESSPQEECIESLAQRAGFVAYMGAKLDLTAEQQPLWDKLQATATAGRDGERQRCTELEPASEQDPPTVLDRMKWKERMLSAQLQALQQVEPAMQALYQALSPEQKEIVDHPFQAD